MSVAEVVDENGARPSSHPASIRPAGPWEKDHEAPSETVPETVPAAASLPNPNSACVFAHLRPGSSAVRNCCKPYNAPVRDIRGVAPPRARPASQPLFPRKCVPVGRLGFALLLNRLKRGARTLSLRPFANAPSLVRVCVCRTHARTQRIKQRRRIPHTEM